MLLPSGMKCVTTMATGPTVLPVVGSKISCHVRALAGNITIRFLGTVHTMPLTVRLPPQTLLPAHVVSRVAASRMPSRKIWAEGDAGSCKRQQRHQQGNGSECGTSDCELAARLAD